MTSVDLQVLDAPITVLEVHIVHVPEVAIRGMDAQSRDPVHGPSEHGPSPPHLDALWMTVFRAAFQSERE